MAEEVQIIRIDTGDAIRNVGELRQYINDLKNSLNDTSKSFEENAKDAEALRAAQAALRDAMYATSTSAEDLLKSSEQLYDENGKLSASYNDLVKQMAALKSAWRSTTDETTRKNLGDQIDKINTELKMMDSSVGNFQRNVGNYGSALNGLGDILKHLPPTLEKTARNAAKVGESMNMISKTPVLGIIGLLAPLVMKIADGLKENETAMGAVKKGLDALKPVTDFFSGVLQTIADFLSDIIGKAAAFVNSNGVFQKVIDGLVGVGNAIVQFVIAPFKAVVEAIKVFKEQGIAGFRDAARAFGNEMKAGVAFKANYEAGQAIGDALIGGVKSKKTQAKGAGKELAVDIQDGLEDIDLDKVFDEVLKELEKAEQDANKIAEDAAKKRLDALASYGDRRKQIAELTIDDERERAAAVYDIEQEYLAKRLDALKGYQQAAYDRGDIDAALSYDQQIADAQVAIEMSVLTEKKRLREQDQKDAEAKAKAQLQIMQSVASATSGILGSIADMYEANAGESADAANKVKALRIVSSTIDTISGAIAAYMGAVESVPGPAGIALGVIQAATVTAAGLANIAKMKATQVPGASSSTSVSTPEPSAFVSAPTVNTDVTAVRNITSASEEDRLNRMASKQKVYLVTSELEANQEDTRVTLEESSW